LFQPLRHSLERLRNATKANFKDDDKRLKNIKTSLIAIGNFIKAQGASSLEARLWDYVSDNYWPQAKKAEKRVSGSKLEIMYTKISEKDAAGGVKDAQANGEASHIKTGTNGASTKIKTETEQGSSGQGRA
ncbi:hypothetical protein LTR04_006754, partial [Oleoguttula sp. CCFEE 6159]